MSTLTALQYTDRAISAARRAWELQEVERVNEALEEAIDWLIQAADACEAAEVNPKPGRNE